MSVASIGGGFHFLNQWGIQSHAERQAALQREKIRKANFPPLATFNNGAIQLLKKNNQGHS